jgi:8-oxo-dGTP diphosphatase
MMLRERNKVIVYVTSADHLLVFRQPEFPEAGLQVPGGTVDHGE